MTESIKEEQLTELQIRDLFLQVRDVKSATRDEIKKVVSNERDCGSRMLFPLVYKIRTIERLEEAMIHGSSQPLFEIKPPLLKRLGIIIRNDEDILIIMENNRISRRGIM